MWPWFKVFGLAVAIDVVWVWAVAAVANRRPWTAAFMSGTLTYIGATMTLAYVAEPGLRWAAVVGAFVGSLVVVSLLPRKAK